MAFSLSSWFKGKPDGSETDGDAAHTKPGKETTRLTSVPPPAPSAPPPAVRTVLPNNPPPAPVSLRTPGAPLAPGAKPPVTRNLSVRPPARKVSFPVPSAVAAPSPAVVPVARPVAMPAPVPQAPDTTVNLEVGDFIDRLPPGFLAPGEPDRLRVIEFRASELYSDLARGRASVPASTIYAKCPELFARPVTDTEDAEIQLPLQKLVEQLSAAFTTRVDQVAEEQVGEIETPFLQVAMEDNARLPTAMGTNAGAIRPAVPLPVPATPEAANGLPQRPAHRTGQISTISAKPTVEPPPAPALHPPVAPPINPGKRPPSTVRASVAGGKIRLSGPATVTRMAPAVPAVPPPLAKPAGNPSSNTQRIEVPRGPVAMPGANSPSHQVAKKTARIQIPPISLKPATGPGGNTPRPPTSVPPPPSLPVQASPVSIRPPGMEQPLSFRTSPPPPPSVKLPPPSFAPQRPSFPPPAFPAVPPSGSAPPSAPGISVPPPAAAVAPDNRKIALGLAATLRAQPASALAVEPEEVPDDVRYTLPFGLVERQLSTGRVVVPQAAFIGALPENYRHVLAKDGGLTEVQIPLQEVFQNLPGNALTMRQDQVIEEIGEAYPTPFSQKAEEDAKRLGGAASAVAPPEAAAAPAFAAEPETAAPREEEAAPAEEFASIFEEAIPASDEAAPEALTDVPADGPAHDVQLDLDEPTLVAEPPAREAAPVTDGIQAAGEAIEPPIAVEPPPVEEALAMLESTAPGEEVSPAPVESKEKPAEARPTPAASPEPALAALAPGKRTPVVAAQDTELQTVLMTEEELDAKGVVRHVCQLPGINGCAVMFADGLRLAGNFPDGDAEGFSAMAPPFFKRTSHFATEAELGALQTLTMHTDKGLFSFFMHEDICLSVRHTGRGFLPGVREKLIVITRELARMYATEKPAESPTEYAL